MLALKDEKYTILDVIIFAMIKGRNRNIFFKIPFTVVNSDAASPGTCYDIAASSLYEIHDFIFWNGRCIIFLVVYGLKILAVWTKNIDPFISA